MDILSFKRRIGIYFDKFEFLSSLLQKLNLMVFHWNDRMHLTHPGKNEPDLVYYVIRPQTNSQGLLSSYLYVMKNLRWALNKGYKVYVNFASEKCQYYTGREINGTTNAWEYYFCQPSDVDMKDICDKKNVLLSGWGKEKEIAPISKKPQEMQKKEIQNLAHNYLDVNDYVKKLAEEKYSKLFQGITLGVFIRGTDYVVLKPKGHARQPDFDDIANKICEFLNKYPIEKIFVVTEDYNYFTKLNDLFGDRIFCSDNYFIKEYKSDDLVQGYFDNDEYERGLNYLIRILLLNKCDYLISGITNGSLVARCLKEDDYKDSYWFDLGNY